MASVAFLASVAFPPNSFGKELGGGAGDIWTFGAGARSLGLGNASIVMAEDATAGYWNPARLSYLERMNFNFLHAGLFEGATYDYAGWAYPMLSAGTVGLSVVRLGIGAVEQRDDNNNLVGDYSFMSQGLGLSYGNRFGSSFSFGASGKYLTRSLPGASSSLASLDMAMDYQAFKHGEIGLVLRDVLFTGVGTEDELPLNVVLGASYGLFEGALKVSSQFEQVGAVTRVGLEYGLGPAALRLGMGGTNAASGGLGMRYGNVQLDYAMMMHELGNSSRFSVGVWLGGSKVRERKSLSQGYLDHSQEAYRAGRFLEAARLMDKSLATNPTDQVVGVRRSRAEKVIGWLRLTTEEMKKPSEDAPSELKRKYTYMLRGLSDYIEANLDGAILLMRQAMAEDPGDEITRRIFETMVEESGRAEEKTKPLLPPRVNIIAKLQEADRFFRQGRFEMATKACEDAIKLDPNNALAYERLGSSYFALGIRDKAFEMWKKSLEINPDNKALSEFLHRFQ
ncbi:MAG: tetratricopeptide repeat protein [Elusimicrobia bacterium]|nr:tetratricopeptide repeat protein [Elusimicrobiota bacterium]